MKAVSAYFSFGDLTTKDLATYSSSVPVFLQGKPLTASRSFLRVRRHSLFILAAFLFLGFELAHAQVPSVISAIRAGGTNADYGFAVAVDPVGNCFVTGYSTGTATFGNTNITSAGGSEIFVAKYDSFGRLLWVRQAGGPGDAEGLAIASDSGGNCLVTGSFSGKVVFGPTNLVAMGTNGTDIFIAKYDGAGNLVWVRQAGGSGSYRGYGSGISVDTNGNSYVSGAYGPSGIFGDVILSGSGGFLAKYDPFGSLIWAKDTVGGGSVAVDVEGNAFVTGSSFGTNRIETMFLAKYNGTGNLDWLMQPDSYLRTNGFNSGMAIALDSFGNVVLTGYFSQNLFFGGEALYTTNINSSGFLAECSKTGQLLWLKEMAGTNQSAGDQSLGKGVATDSFGNCFVSGLFSGNATFGSTHLVSIGDPDDFVAKYDNRGNLMWVVQMGGIGYDDADGIAWHPDKGLYFTGGFYGEAAFGNTILTSMGGPDIFLARMVELPILTINSATNEGILCWPTNPPGFVLEKATNLSSSPIWSVVTNVAQVGSGRNLVTDQVSNHNSFYRLRKP